MLSNLLKPGVSVTMLANEYGCSKAYVSRVASGKQKPSSSFKEFCAKKFGIPEKELFPEERMIADVK